MADVTITNVEPGSQPCIGAVLVDKNGDVILSDRGEVILQSYGSFSAETSDDEHCDICIIAYTCFNETPPENSPTKRYPDKFGESQQFGYTETDSLHGGKWRGWFHDSAGGHDGFVMMRNKYVTSSVTGLVPVYPDRRLDGALAVIGPSRVMGGFGFLDKLFPTPPAYAFHSVLKWLAEASCWELVSYYSAMYKAEFRLTDGTVVTRDLPVEPGKDPFGGRYGSFPLCLWRQAYRSGGGLRGFHDGKIFTKFGDSFFVESSEFPVSSSGFTGSCHIQFLMDGTVPPAVQKTYYWVKLEVLGGDYGGVTFWYTSDPENIPRPARWEEYAVDAYGDSMEFPGWWCGERTFTNPKAPGPLRVVGFCYSGVMETPVQFINGKTKFPDTVVVTSYEGKHPNVHDVR